VRKIILGLGVSIDGYIARLDGTFDFLFMPKDFSMAEFFASIDTGIAARPTMLPKLWAKAASGRS